MLDFTQPHPLRDDNELDTAVREVDRLLDSNPEPGTEAFDELESLSALIRAYEQDRHPDIWEPPSQRDLVDFVLEQHGLSRADLNVCMGGERCTSEFFSGSRRLSLEQIMALRDKLGIPPKLLTANGLGR